MESRFVIYNRFTGQIEETADTAEEISYKFYDDFYNTSRHNGARIYGTASRAYYRKFIMPVEDIKKAESDN